MPNTVLALTFADRNVTDDQAAENMTGGDFDDAPDPLTIARDVLGWTADVEGVAADRGETAIVRPAGSDVHPWIVVDVGDGFYVADQLPSYVPRAQLRHFLAFIRKRDQLVERSGREQGERAMQTAIRNILGAAPLTALDRVGG